jgi:hypothetical protein
MKTEWVFPIILIVGNLGASIVYAVKGKPLSSWYWAAALQLNVCVFMMALKAGK